VNYSINKPIGGVLPAGTIPLMLCNRVFPCRPPCHMWRKPTFQRWSFFLHQCPIL